MSAVLAHNGVEFFDVQFACARTGSICVLLNWRFTVSELEYIINDSSPMLLVHDVEFAESAQRVAAPLFASTRCSRSTAAHRTAPTRPALADTTERLSSARRSPTTT